MKKYLLPVLVFGIVAFLAGYRLGSARAYDRGFDDGYSYDCRAELGNIAKYVYSVKKDLRNVGDSLHLVRQNLRSAIVTDVDKKLDSLRSSGVKDTMIEYVDEQGRRNSKGFTVLGKRRSGEWRKKDEK